MTTEDEDAYGSSSTGCNAQILASRSKKQKASHVDSKTIAASSMSKRKQKEMEKYVAKKLKKDARPAILERLRLVNQNVDLSIMQSTRNLQLARHQRQSKDASDDDAALASESSEENDHDDVLLPTRSFVSSVPNVSVDLYAEIDAIKKSSLNPLADLDSTYSSCSSTSSSSEEEEEEEFVPQPVGFVMDAPVFGGTHHVATQRTEQVEAGRIKLPVYAEEQVIMDTIQHNAVTFIYGETGSGKTTQIPQFLLEAGFGDALNCPMTGGLIGVTQPRRVAAISMAQRVGIELNDAKLVGHQVRNDSSTVREGTSRIKFMTDGILLAELEQDFLLQKYSVLILDEAHERNVNTDILLGMLSRIVRLRNAKANSIPQGPIKPLRLVIMSATLDVDELCHPRLFGNIPPPVVSIQTRQHPVTMHFARSTATDHVQAAYDMIRHINATQPAQGAILVFLTGKHEIHSLARRLMADTSCWQDDDGDDDLIMDDASCSDGNDLKTANGGPPLHVLPLYASLASDQQMRVFEEPPSNCRLVVLATNVAETSITIPNVRFVVDSGLCKQKRHTADGTDHYSITWISKASATQRAGRAGRVGPGHCYRLYSSAVFEHEFPQHADPEILRTPIESLVLSLRCMGIDHPSRFPLPTMPRTDDIESADLALQRLGAVSLKPSSSSSPNGEQLYLVTALGSQLNRLPLAPKWARIIVAASTNDQSSSSLIFLATALATAGSLGDPFEEISSDRQALKTQNQTRRSFGGQPTYSDLLVSMNVLLRGRSAHNRIEFCQQHGIMSRWLDEAILQFNHHLRLVSQLLINSDSRKSLPDEYSKSEIPLHHRQSLCKLIAASFTECIAERVLTSKDASDAKALITHPTYKLRNAVTGELDANSPLVYLHPSSALYAKRPNVIIYSNLTRSSHTPDRMYIRTATAQI